MPWTVAIDVGGTFTDGVARSDAGDELTVKVPSVPDDPARGLLAAIVELDEAGLPLHDVSLVFHGTTIATNAVINDSLARVVLLATDGFRDVLAYRWGPALRRLQPAPGGTDRVRPRCGQDRCRRKAHWRRRGPDAARRHRDRPRGRCGAPECPTGSGGCTAVQLYRRPPRADARCGSEGRPRRCPCLDLGGGRERVPRVSANRDHRRERRPAAGGRPLPGGGESPYPGPRSGRWFPGDAVERRRRPGGEQL